jgi:8-oxo-dGTP pyrophosphatase MutT (NUDIX family)
MFRDFRDKIREALTMELPGELAHKMMMPTVRNDNLKMPPSHTPPVKSAVLLLMYPGDEGQINFPLIQRPTYNGAHSGQVSLPGGKAEPTDESLIYTALREAKEEVGIIPADIEVIGRMTNLFIWVSNYIVTPVVALCNQKPAFQKDPKEVDSIIETDLHDIINPSKRKEGTVFSRGQYQIQSPYIDINKKVVWGATAMMLNELSMIVDKAKIY